MATALLVIDVQRELVDYLPPQRRTELLSTLGATLERARSAGIPVVYVRHDGGASELTPGTPGWEIAHEIAPHAGEPIVDKRFPDSFRETNLADVLGGLDVDHVVVCGMQTEYCVDFTLREADRRGYRVTLIEDGHATYAAEGASEEQIRRQVHRVARGIPADLVPAARLFTDVRERV
jgi:nicotinamidase-related amidase